ncbi:MAG: glycosyltransferase [Terracidiphilus sp.]|jgi:UDP:flavonoid glycosyltransferase YjiC (YdhE family)
MSCGNAQNKQANGTAPKQILIATIGSLGDLHPCIALALELKRRGHRVTIASTEYYRAKIESLGIAFHPIRPNWDPTDREMISQCDDLKRGVEVLYRQWILPHLKDTYQDLLSAAPDTDLMIAGELNLAAPLVAEKLNLRWVSAILSPASFLSSRDPSVLVNVPWLFHVRKAGWPVYSAILNVGRMGIQYWWAPVRELRRRQNLRPHCDPVFRDKFSPDLVLALFSRWLAQPQADWPRQTIQPGFIWFDQKVGSADADPQLAAFLASGEPPIVFTQGSTAVHNPGDFYAVSAEAARMLNRRALLVGANSTSGLNSSEILAIPYAPYSQIFPHAAVNVHQGGSGTTGQALRAGRPQLIIPFGWDQPDNAARVERIGAGMHLPRAEWSPATAAAALDRLLREPQFSDRATQIGAEIRAEDGLNSACDAIESLLRS